jgi:phospholipase D1/2
MTDVERAGVLVDGRDYYLAFHRAAQNARRYILLSGWQFDSEVELLRGDDVAAANGAPTALLSFLNSLCEQNDELEVYILAWDFHMVFALEREWMQKLVFHWKTHKRLKFEFDSSHVDKGCHHQKFVVVDGVVSFLGGLDLCDHRWDDRRHLEENPLRVSRGEPAKPFHDVQAYAVSTSLAESLRSLFVCRWEAAGGGQIVVPEGAQSNVLDAFAPEGAIAIAANRLALSRTDPHGAPTKTENCREVCDLYVRAIEAAEHLIYIETQYFSSRELCDALSARIRAVGAPLQIVLVLNMEAETMKEQIAIGLAQAKVLKDLRFAVTGTRHQLGIYYTVPEPKGPEEPELATYIHAKVMVVDDRFLNVGSANLTNRSASVDTELNASWESAERSGALYESIRAARLNLLAEHVGVPSTELDRDDLVAHLDGLATARTARLRMHPSPTEQERKVLDVIDPEALPFDPSAVEPAADEKPLFARGAGAVFRRLFSERDDRK